MRNLCPSCGSNVFVKNGLTSYGKQNYKCRECGRQFVMELDPKSLTEDKKQLIQKLLKGYHFLRIYGTIFTLSNTLYFITIKRNIKNIS